MYSKLRKAAGRFRMAGCMNIFIYSMVHVLLCALAVDSVAAKHLTVIVGSPVTL